MRPILERIFSPESLAIIGATEKEGSVGQSVCENLVHSDYKGNIYPVNPKRESIMGKKTYPSITEVPEKVDLAVIVTPAATVPAIVEECGKAGVSGVLIISAGFQEAGEEGQRMVAEILETGRKYSMRVVGPNCLGFIKPSASLNASFASKMAPEGNIAFVSQSGALCTAILDWAVEQKVGFSYFVSIGSMIDIGFHDLIDHLGEDPNTSSIVIYMESLSEARKFMSAARAFSRNKPIIVLKSGKSTEGAQAAMSHTGSLAGNDSAFDAAFQRSGIIRVNTITELFNCAEALAKQPRPKQNRLAIVTNAGGPGVIATDRLIEKEGVLAQLSPTTIRSLDQVLPEAWSHGNPVDVLGDADAQRFQKAVQACLDDPGVDGVLVIVTPQAMTDSEAIAQDLVKISNPRGKTILASFMGESEVEGARDILRQGGIPEFPAPEQGTVCFLQMYSYTRNLELLYETPASTPEEFTPRTTEARELIERKLDTGKLTFTEREAKSLLSYYEIPITDYRLAGNEEEAGRIATKLGFPVVMKISSPDILHKTEVKGIRVNIKSREEAWQAFREIISNARKYKPEAHIEGVFVEKMVSKKYELILGAKKDPIFGPIIVFGMGGVAVEVFKDTNIGLPPLNMALAFRLIEDTKIYKLLSGYRGMEGADIESIQYLIYKFSYLLMDFPEIKEVDINPFCVDHEGGVTVDAKVILDDKYQKGETAYSHLVISPYPYEYVTTFTLKNGKEVILRPIRPEDEPMEAEMFTKFSKETQRFRFFQYLKDTTHHMLVRYTQIDYDREIAIVVETEEFGKKMIAGVVRLIADAYNETAEFAIVVADPWQGQGLGNKLSDFILEIARKRGIKTVKADVLNDNNVMLHMFKRRGFEVVQRYDDSLTLALDLENVKEPTVTEIESGE